MSAEAHAEHLEGICESHPIYRDERIIHPGTILRLANFALMQNATLGPWIHLGGTLQQLRPCHVGDSLTIRSQVVGNREKKGRRLVETTALVVANDTTPAALLQHSALYSLG
jgi:acyl dehydratase